MKYEFSKAILNNIARTYTYAHAKNAHRYDLGVNEYDPYSFFEELLAQEPFAAFMELDRYGFKNTKNALDRYKIPYTQEQERKAKIFYDVTTKMQNDRSDYVHMYVEDEDLINTGVVLYRDPYILTTQDTLNVKIAIDELPTNRKTDNILYGHMVPNKIKDTKEQMDALNGCLENHIACLIGGAGTGKSYVTAEIINQLNKNGKNVAILAPTHKAKEALQTKLKNGTVKTIHSFVHNPFDCDVIVIDESGMLSTPLFNKLMKIHRDQQLIFVGDKNQIPPVEYGRPFERVQNRFKTFELIENHRSEAPDIIALGREILGIPQNANMAFENVEVVNSSKEAFERGAEVVLTFTNANVKQVNEEQKIKNGTKSISNNFSIGDVIIAKTNDSERFYNGQLFRIIARNKIANQTNGRVIELKSAIDLDFNFDLAYGLTIHKSQGSEWDVVAYQPSALDTRNLAYVAVTRAKKKLIIVGDGLQSEYMEERKWKQLQ